MLLLNYHYVHVKAPLHKQQQTKSLIHYEYFKEKNLVSMNVTTPGE